LYVARPGGSVGRNKYIALENNLRAWMRRRGYEVFRAAACAKACARVRTAALAEAAARPWTERIREALSSEIRAPWRRAHVALDLTDDVRAVLTAATARAAPSLSAAGIDDDAYLVELSCMVAFPGATEQASHADVPRASETPTATLWVLLQDVALESGPTHVYPDDCDARALTLATEARRPTHYAPDGEPEADTAPSDAPAAVALTGVAGDAVAMDCRLVHYGGANASAKPRVQLSATFRRGEGGGDGFTYRLRESLPPLTLGDARRLNDTGIRVIS
jgi:hypothetical protein